MPPQILTVDDLTPDVDPSAWIAPGAVVVGAATIGPEVGVWYTAVVRADHTTITVGAGSNLQDGTVVHADPGFPASIGADGLPRPLGAAAAAGFEADLAALRRCAGFGG